jgi:hypothetical protein
MKLLVFTFLLGFIFLLFSLEGNAANWDIVYDGSILPYDKSLGKDVFLFGDANVEKNLKDFVSVVKDDDAVNGTALHIKDTKAEGGRLAFFKHEVNFDTGTAEVRVKSLENTDGWAVGFGMGDGSLEIDVHMYPDRVEIYQGSKYDVDMKTYRVVRAVKEGKNATIYVDGKQVLKGVVFASTNLFWWGAGSSNGIGDGYWDYLAYTLSGAFSPDKLPSPLVAPVESRGKLTTTWASIKK